MDFTTQDLSKEQVSNIKKIGAKAQEYGIDPDLALAIAWKESHFLNQINPESGTIGIMQINPRNAKGLNLKVEDLHDVDTNIDAGMRILKENLDTFGGNERAALVAYNASPTTAKRYLESKENPDSLPAETKTYLEDIHSVRPLVEGADEEEVSFKRPSASPVDKNTYKAPEQDEASWISQHPSLTGAGAGAASGIGEKLYKYGQESASKAKIDPLISEEAMKSAQTLTSGDKWATAIGGPGGKDVSTAAKNYQMTKGLEGGETLTRSGIILPPGAKEKLEADLETTGQKISRKLTEKYPLYKKGVEAGKVMSKGAAKVLSKLAPFSTTATGLIGGSQIGESAERFKRGDIKGGVLSGLSGAANIAATQPFNPVLRGAAGLASIPLDIADFMYDPEQYSVVKESLKKKKD